MQVRQLSLVVSLLFISSITLSTYQFHTSREEARSIQASLLSAFELMHTSREAETLTLRTAIRSLRDGQQTLGASLNSQSRRVAGEESISNELAEQPPDELEARIEVFEFPEEINPLSLIEQHSTSELASDPFINPDARALTDDEFLRIQARLKLARARLDAVKAEQRIAVQDAKRQLKSHGEYLEFGHGEAHIVQRGVYTHAELLPDKTKRMYYMSEESFPNIYRDAERSEVAATALRDIMRFVQQPDD